MRPTFVAALACAAALPPTAPAPAATYTQLYAFQGGNDGGVPNGGLLWLNGLLYGTTSSYGPNGAGTVFSLNPATSEKQIIHGFGAPGDGVEPEGITSANNTLYGTTLNGGVHHWGTVFSMNPTTGAEQIIAHFDRSQRGYSPSAPPAFRRGKLYGPAYFGGAYGAGTIFKANPQAGIKTDIYAFGSHPNDALGPDSALLVVADTLYGTSQGGGANNAGALFAVNAKTGAETVVYAFVGGTDGDGPQGAPIDSGGTLYGVTEIGGQAGQGTVYAVNATTGAETIVYSFLGGTDGQNPRSSLIMVGATLYGTTAAGGKSTACYQGCGTLFSLDPATGHETLLHSFRGGSDGAGPGALLYVAGTLYGITGSGGAAGYGTVFAYTP